MHVAVWLLLILNDILPNFGLNAYPVPQAGSPSLSAFLQRLTITVCYYSVSALCFYGSCRVVAPCLFLKKRYVQGILLLLALWAAVAGWRFLLEYGFLKPVLGFDNYFGRRVPASYYIMNVFWHYFPKYFVYGLVYFFAESWIRNRNRQEALQREQLTTELAFLRSQINPHFLFNTINDIYALTYQQSPQAPEALLKLSELLRYMLREGAGDFVALQSEVDYLNNLVALQRIGAKGNAYIHFEVEGNAGRQQVASLLFVAFVENAFKHGVLNDPAHPVLIRMQAADERIDFMVRNQYHHSQQDKTPGIGLANVKRRLELLYPGRHQLQIAEGTADYTIHLTLQLTA